MQAGKLRHRIEVQEKTVTHNELNEEVAAWETARKLWADARETGAREVYQAQKLWSEASAVFVVRYTLSVTGHNRIGYAGRTFEILGTYDPEGTRRALYLAAKEVTT
jgi:SPP1 family predicted phage head-tail adaptor